MKDYSPNRRIEQARRNGDVVRTTTTVPKAAAAEARVRMPRPMPGVIILVHGVNDVGEAYATQARGLCAGLNQRLGRTDLTPGDWDTPKACPQNRAASYQRRANSQGYNSIIPFYWGYRPVDEATYAADQARYREELRRRGPAGADAPYDAYYIEGRNDPKRGYENVDCFNNRLDEHFAKNGGVFANATTTLIDMWGPGGDILGLARWASRHVGDDLSHPVYENPHRIYFIHAAQRLANLIAKIRGEQQTENDSINIVAHSQGTLVALLANFLVTQATPARRPADCLILNHSPYSLETPRLEGMQSFGPQQSQRARTETLANLCRLIDAQRMPGPAATQLAAGGIASRAAAAIVAHMRDNHGKVFNYFCPHDMTVSLRNVKGIGWQGVPPEVAERLGPAFAQRIFLHGRPLHTPPGRIDLPDLQRKGAKSVATNADIPTGAPRDINAPGLPDFGYTFALPAGCTTLGPSDWDVFAAAAAETGNNLITEPRPIPDPRHGIPPTLPGRTHELPPHELATVEAAFTAQGKPWRLTRAIKAGDGLVITRYMSNEELREKARTTTTEISNHSAIVLDENAARCATSFDLAVGRCCSYDEGKVDGGPFWQELLRLADWRFSAVKEDRDYYTKGLLPKAIKDQMNKPSAISGIVNVSTATNSSSRALMEIDERIARLERERGRWSPREWDELMRDLQRERHTLEQMHDNARREQSLFPVAHGQ
ncbi:T6SS effector phospholipase Tle3 domain-containing protein [Aromatoleum petrolei]|uniref:DUF3274 domain-containing protein n=1 Tax=Aromatoleum petrolei TaxID=76116 RepID=A0ABX1MYN2_9RHOO|nr:DUF3274 domain-containing protein [Aromatoleum petrolei]NMF91029.1 DUF3274 domain-containing protein [Aromatoleum petrolei]QTQ35919.1 putative protein DUF3274 [Aromatoleum petrolei]